MRTFCAAVVLLVAGCGAADDQPVCADWQLAGTATDARTVDGVAVTTYACGGAPLYRAQAGVRVCTFPPEADAPNKIHVGACSCFTEDADGAVADGFEGVCAAAVDASRPAGRDGASD